MTIATLKDNWNHSFQDAIKSIENSLNPQSHDDSETSNFRTLANWLMKTQHSPYDFMTNDWINYLNNPYEADTLLSNLHHALVDDGEVSFVNMKLENETIRVFIVFADRYEDYFKTICEKENASLMNSFMMGRESINRVLTGMKEKNPDKIFNLKPLISKEDFLFESHRDPLLFIKDFENYQIKVQEERLKLNKKLESLKK